MTLVADDRYELLTEWLEKHPSFRPAQLSVASADASFRRYFRLKSDEGSLIAMDAPPELEDSAPFVRIGRWMGDRGVRVPQILEYDLDLGFMVLSDFGTLHLQDAILRQDPTSLYNQALEEILGFQQRLSDSKAFLPTFDPSWQRKELEIFRDWCLPEDSKERFDQAVSKLIDLVDQIPKSFMHRDFHCRNLLLTDQGKLGIIDFQGAMHGPVAYDLVSLLRDCYLDFENDWVEEKVGEFRVRMIEADLLDPSTDLASFLQWFDLCGLQRHLKCLGIFHRLKIRDGKASYLKEVPRVLAYVAQVIEKYSDLDELRPIVDQAKIIRPV